MEIVLREITKYYKFRSKHPRRVRTHPKRACYHNTRLLTMKGLPRISRDALRVSVASCAQFSSFAQASKGDSILRRASASDPQHYSIPAVENRKLRAKTYQRYGSTPYLLASTVHVSCFLSNIASTRDETGQWYSFDSGTRIISPGNPGNNVFPSVPWLSAIEIP